MERKNDNHFFSKFRQILWLIQFCQESWCEKAGDVNDSTGSEKCNLIHNFFFFFFIHIVIPSTFFLHFYSFSFFCSLRVQKFHMASISFLLLFISSQ